MPKRTVCVFRPARISVRNACLVVSQGEREGRLPLEDIWVVVLESHVVQITVAALSSLVDAGIGVMVCGDTHMPNGLLLPIGAHSRHAAIVDDQLAISRPLKKRLWQSVVRAKISNQARVLDLLDRDSSGVWLCSREVQSGDASSRESVAAGLYFREYLTEGTRRTEPYASPLDYGYGILRAGVAREVVAGGWLVSRGIHHDSELNAFNLVDDLIEPFRPVVDLLVAEHGLRGELTHEVKIDLASIFEYEVRMPSGVFTVQGAISDSLHSLREAVLESDYRLLRLPEVIPLRKACIE